MLRCETCGFLLDDDDNYCRHCGAAVEIVAPAAEPRAVVPSRPLPAGLLRSTAAPLVTGATAVVATALLKWVLRQTVRGMVAGVVSPRATVERAPERAPARREPAPVASAARPGEVVEVFWYRRWTRG